MNKFIKLPLFLGSICLVFCSTLAVVVNICQPIITEREYQKQLEAYNVMYSNVSGLEDVETDTSNYSRIDSIKLITHANGESYVYTLTTGNPQTDTFTFMLGLNKATGEIDGYSMITDRNPEYGGTKYSDNSTMLNDLKADGQITHTAGQTKSEKVMHEAINQAKAHYQELTNLGGEE